jgi:membrane protease YdiL (CAAX protease family)
MGGNFENDRPIGQSCSAQSGIQRITSWADLAALSFAAIFPFAAAWVYLVVMATHDSSVAVRTTYGAAKVLQFALPAIWIGLICRQSLRLPLMSTSGVKAGLLLGVAVAGGMLLLYYFWLKPMHYMAQFAAPIKGTAASFGMESPAAFAAGGVLFSLVHSLLEEYYWRWFVFGGLRRYMPVAAAVVVSAVAFTAHHVILLATFFGALTLPAIFFSLCVAVGGAAWAVIYHRSGSLLGPWLSHATIDAGIFVVGYDILFR